MSKYNTGTCNKKNKHHIFAPTVGARGTIFSKLCVVIELVVPVKKVPFISRSNVVFPTGCKEKFGLIYTSLFHHQVAATYTHKNKK